jgi:hypothetical protein
MLRAQLEILASLQKERGDIILQARPGKRIRSGVTVPESATLQGINGRAGCEESDDDDLEVEPPACNTRS